MRGSRPPRSRSTALVEAMQVEFTGERVIPGRVDADLLNEHMARYAFAARLARGKRGVASHDMSKTARVDPALIRSNADPSRADRTGNALVTMDVTRTEDTEVNTCKA